MTPTDSSVSEAGNSYWNHITNAASLVAFEQARKPGSLLSAEAIPENSSLIDFKTFAHEYPEKLFPLLLKLRPEFQEYFIEYYLLGKSQSFIGKTHGCIQTRIWQALRIIEQTVGALIILGTAPDQATLRPILEKAGVETTEYGSLSAMIVSYAASQSYAKVAAEFQTPGPAIRKIFRPLVTTLLASKDVHAVAVGAYLRNLTHQASLTRAGLSKSSKDRTKRVKTQRFWAPPSDESPLLSFGRVETLGEAKWSMLEISSEHRMAQIHPLLLLHGKKLFGKKAAQIFAPVNANGELSFGYIFARCLPTHLVRSLTRVRGISEIASVSNDDGSFVKPVLVPNADVQQMIETHEVHTSTKIRLHDFVEILTGACARYCGTVVKTGPKNIIVEVVFPTGRHFLITADGTGLKQLKDVSVERRTFWGQIKDAALGPLKF